MLVTCLSSKIIYIALTFPAIRALSIFHNFKTLRVMDQSFLCGLRESTLLTGKFIINKLFENQVKVKV